MKAAQINSYGGIDVLEINENAPKPSPTENQVLVEIYTTSINPIDYKIRKGYLKQFAPLNFPTTLGGDFAGRVVEVGEGVTNYKVGDEVYGTTIVLSGGSGAFAEMGVANTKNIALKPKSASYIEAAALPLAGSSALQGVEGHIKLKKGQRILIHGGAGGIGHLAIQIAKEKGAYVATTVSGDDKEFVKNLGADQAIDYKNENFAEVLKKFDAVFDTVGGETDNKSFIVLKTGGILVSMLGSPDETLAQKYSVTAIGQNTHTNKDHLNRLRELVDSNTFKVHVDKVFPLDQIKEAFKYQEEGHPRGKVVINIKDQI
ncbi:NADP-dependent oxidoreductase [Candidatus Gottesmanbacteria bacterium]|nr:NADP-dependent oxidoreductase [Candidatus Gottesmanbacteria bacterium]